MHWLLYTILISAGGPDLTAWVMLAGDLLAVSHTPSVIARRQGRPAAALAWILALFALPYLGVVLWWFLGRTHLLRPATRRRRSLSRFRPTARSTPGENARNTIMRGVLPFSFHPRRWEEGVFPSASIPRPIVFAEGQAFDDLERTVGAARKEIRILFYIWENDETGRRMRDLLCERARAGVRVCVLLDGKGSSGLGRTFMAPLRRAGGQVAFFLPVRFRPWAPTLNFRNHRKLVLIDGEIAYTGGINIGDDYRRRWHDFFVRFAGEVVEHFDEVFREDWHFATGTVLAPLVVRPKISGGDTLCTLIASGPDRIENRVHDCYFSLVANARRRVWLTTPYFVPGPALVAALKTASLRGTDVRILIPDKSDIRLVSLASRSYYETMQASGIRIFHYERAVLHAKVLVIDQDVVAIGTANADARSFRLNFELVCFLGGIGFNRTMAELFEQDLVQSREITASELSQRTDLQRWAESLARLMGPLL